MLMSKRLGAFLVLCRDGCGVGFSYIQGLDLAAQRFQYLRWQSASLYE